MNTINFFEPVNYFPDFRDWENLLLFSNQFYKVLTFFLFLFLVMLLLPIIKIAWDMHVNIIMMFLFLIFAHFLKGV